MINGKKVLAVTLARGGSERIPKKNIADICGKPLLQYTVDAVTRSAYVDDYYISTDDNDIIDVCNKLGVKNILRPIYLSSSISKSSDTLIHAVEHIGGDFFYVVEVMATNPFKTFHDIDGCLKMIVSSNVESVVSVVRVWDHHPSRVKYLDNNNKMHDFYPEILESRRQDLSPAAYVRNGSIYAMTKEFLLRERTRYNKNTIAYIMPEERTINIDEPIDLELARLKMRNRHKTGATI